MMHATAASGWSLSGSLLTFAFPIALIAVAATVLYLLFSQPHRVPGHNWPPNARKSDGPETSA